MINKSIAIYVFIDDLLKKIEYKEPTNRNMSDAEIITTVLVSAIYFSGHHEKAMSFMSSTGMIKHMLSKSRFNRRLHQIRDLIVDLFFQLSALVKELNIGSEYSIDSFPVSTCDNIRIIRTKLVQGAVYCGKKVSMRKRIESAFSEISNFLPKKIHAVTEFGFLLKVVIFIFGYTISRTLF